MRARDNPFATARIHEIRYQLSGISWNDLLSRLERMNHSGAIVGPEGSGKTAVALLEVIVARLLAGAGWSGDVRIDALYRRHRGNVREALRELYDLYADGGELR